MPRTKAPGVLPEAIVADLETAASGEEFDAIIKSAYAAGWNLRQIGESLGVSREAVRWRLRRPVNVRLLRSYATAARAATPMLKEARRLDNRKILGFRRSHPVLRIPVNDLNRIAELQALVTQNRGCTPLDAPSRLAIPEYGELLMRVHSEYGVPQGVLPRVFGLSPRTFDRWLELHGYRPAPPSQKAYQGVQTARGKVVAR